MLGSRGFGGGGSILDIDEIKIGVLGFGSPSGDFRGDDRDRSVAARAILLATNQRWSSGFTLSVTGSRGQFRGSRVFATGSRCSWSFLTRNGFWNGRSFRGSGGGLLVFLGWSFGERPLDLLREVEARSRYPL